MTAIEAILAYARSIGMKVVYGECMDVIYNKDEFLDYIGDCLGHLDFNVEFVTRIAFPMQPAGPEDGTYVVEATYYSTGEIVRLYFKPFQ